MLRQWALGFVVRLATFFHVGGSRAAVLLLLSSQCAGEQVGLAWDQNTEPDLGGYRVQYGLSPGPFTESIDVGPLTAATIDGLQPGTAYSFVVSAYNGAGLESAPSAPVFYRTAQIFSRQTYKGLIGESGGGAQGNFTATLSKSGSVSGRVFLGGKSYSWRGVFDLDGSLSLEVLSRKKTVIASVSLQLAGDTSEISGQVAINDGLADLIAHSAPLATSISPHAGRYTMVLSTPDSALGGGYGYGVINVAKRGALRVTGKLPAGASFTAGSTLDSAQSAPLYLYRPIHGWTVLGRITFQEVPAESDAHGTLRLLRTSIPEEVITIQAARFLEEGAATNAAPPVALQMMGVGNSPVLAELSTGRPMVGLGPFGERIVVRVVPRTGLFSGSSVSPFQPGFTFAGALYQKGSARGFGRVHAARGSVELHNTSP